MNNIADGNYEPSYYPNVVMNYTGRTYWIPPAIYKSSCTMEVDYFPFDQQECEMKFGSWTYNAKQMNFTFLYGIKSLDVTDYLLSGAWDIIDCPGRIETFIDDGSGEEQTRVVFKFILRRKILFYIVNLIIPCVLISFVSVFVFALPTAAWEKITLCISILLSLVVFLLLISKMLPPSLNIPLISKYLLFTFIMNIISICFTVIIINANYRTPRTHRMPRWVRIVFLRYLPMVLLMKRPDHSIRWKKPISDTQRDSRSQSASRSSIELLELQHQHTNCILPPNIRSEAQREGTKEEDDNETPEDRKTFRMTAEIWEATNDVLYITKHMKDEDCFETVIEDWKFVASVIDRLLLYIFLIVTTFGTIGIVMQAPHLLQTADQEQILAGLRAKWT